MKRRFPTESAGPPGICGIAENPAICGSIRNGKAPFPSPMIFRNSRQKQLRGYGEGDTVAGKKGKACLITLVDRKSRYLTGGKAEKKNVSNRPCRIDSGAARTSRTKSHAGQGKGICQPRCCHGSCRRRAVLRSIASSALATRRQRKHRWRITGILSQRERPDASFGNPCTGDICRTELPLPKMFRIQHAILGA